MHHSTFHTVLIAACSLFVLSNVLAENLIRNPSFEEPASSSSRHALHWKINEPDTHGDAYGSASREDWRSWDGMNIMTIRGTWADAGSRGGIWQDVPCEPGTTYKATAWFWADSEWEATTQEFKMEFWPATYGTPLHTEVTALDSLAPEWRKFEVIGTAPEGGERMRVVVHVAGAGYYGALQIDHFYLSPQDAYVEPEADPKDLIIDVIPDDE